MLTPYCLIFHHIIFSSIFKRFKISFSDRIVALTLLKFYRSYIICSLVKILATDYCSSWLVALFAVPLPVWHVNDRPSRTKCPGDQTVPCLWNLIPMKIKALDSVSAGVSFLLTFFGVSCGSYFFVSCLLLDHLNYLIYPVWYLFHLFI